MNRHTKLAWFGGVLAGLCLWTGCHRAGQVEIASLNYVAIDPPAPRVSRVGLDHCYWWMDEEGRVQIAMERDQSWVLGPTHVEHFVFQMALTLEKPPAGKSRNYLLSKRQMNGAARFGPAHSRFVSAAGIVALYREPGDHMRGSFRIRVARQGLQLLGGWSPVSRHLMMGTFIAKHDEERGQRIVAQVAENGWPVPSEDAAAPTTQPTSTSP